jgi:pimeloyl-ACP methyl ester carboxylesterase
MKLIVQSLETYAYTAGRDIDRNLPSVIFIHGAANDHSVWALQSRYFAYHGWNALAVDLPGHGASKGTPLAAVGAMADWISELIDALKLETVAIVGHSMGSLAALETAGRYPEKISKLVMVGTAVPMAVSDTLLNAAIGNEHAALDMVNIWGHTSAAQIGSNPLPGVWMAGDFLRLLEKSKPDVLGIDLKACNDYKDGIAAAAKVICRTLLLLGKQDMMTSPKMTKELTSTLKDCRVVVLDRAGHVPMAEEPDATLDALKLFLNGLT